MKNFSFVFVVLFALLTVACSSNPLSTHYTNIRLAISLNKDAQANLSDVSSSSVDLASIRSSNRPLAIIAKAFSEFGKDKWISEDKAMLVFENGRVIRTLGFENDLLGTFAGHIDPLAEIRTVANKSWYRELDWSAGEYGYSVNSTFTSSNDHINIFDTQFSTIHIVEQVVYGKEESLFKSHQWENHYWFHSESGVLLRSSQQAAPFSDRFDIVFLSDATRLISVEEGK